MSIEEPRAAARTEAVRAVVLVVSSTRTIEDDTNGAYIVHRLVEAGHGGADRRMVSDDRTAIRAAVQDAVKAGARLVLITGGTGVSGRDVTPDAIEPLFHKPLPGFGELFRMRSFAEVGASAMGSRATAGIVGDSLVFAIPASRRACELALSELILPVVGTLMQHLELAPEPAAAGSGPAGWERAVVDGSVERGPRPAVPSSLEGFGPAEQLLAQAGETGRLAIDGRTYTLWGFPDLGARSKVLAVGTGQDVEIVGLHRHHPTGIGSSAWWAPPGDVEARVHAVVGQPLPIAGTWFGCTSEAVYVTSDGRVWRFDGRRTTEMGTEKQALATLMLELTRR